MYETIERLKASDFEEAIDLLDLVFSKAYQPHDFATLLPQIYQPTDTCMGYNWAYKRDGRIRGIVGVFPMKVIIGDRELRFAGIGGVATHPRERGRGMMKELMSTCMQHINSEGYHLSFLSGDRQRYANHGYEKAGSTYNYIVTKSSFKKSMAQPLQAELHFEQIYSNEKEKICYAKKLFDRQLFHCVREKESFYLNLISQYNQPWAILDINNQMIGYLVSNNDKTHVCEIYLEDICYFKAAMAAWILEFKVEKINLTVSPWQIDNIRCLGEFCDGFYISESLSWMVRDWVTVISALLEMKSKYKKLVEGEISIEILDYGVVSIGVRNVTDDLGCGKHSIVVCEKTNKSPDIVLNRFTATRLLLGSIPCEGIMLIPDKIVHTFSSWFPLPLSWQGQDSI